MLNQSGTWTSHNSYFPPFPNAPASNRSPLPEAISISPPNKALPSILLNTDIPGRRVRGKQCDARRRVIYYDEEEDDEYGYNDEIALLETYTRSVKDEVLLVKAVVDEERADVLIFKGFSSSLSYKTSTDPTRSVLPRKAVIESIDIIRGPFDPSDIHYIEKGLSFDQFKNRLS